MTRELRCLALVVALLASLTPSLRSEPAVDLDVDTDRSGVIDAADEAGEDAWSSGRGAVFTVNYDDDDGDGPDSVTMRELDGAPQTADTTIDGPGDLDDITPLVVRLPMARSDVTSVNLRGDGIDGKAVHLFGSVAAGATKIWGGPSETSSSVDLTDRLTYEGETTLGLEGLFFRWMMPDAYGGTFPSGFDGLVDLRLEVTLTDATVVADDVTLKVAPLVLTPNTQDALETFEVQANNLIPGSTGTGGGNQWTQDHVEMGYTRAPGRQPQYMVFRLPYERVETTVLPTWPQDLLLGPDTGTFLLQRAFGAGSGDYGGNLEVLPPMPSWPLGRVIVGNTMSDQLWGFLRDQEVQDPLAKDTVDTSWLAVGHVDEIFGFVPDGDSSVVVYADPERAHDMLAAGFADDGVFFSTGATSTNMDLTASGSLPNQLLDAGVDFRTIGYANFLRIYDGTGAGQIAQIRFRADGALTIIRVWMTPQDVVWGPVPVAESQLGCQVPCTDSPALVNVAGTWIVPPDATSRYVLFEGTKSWLSSVGGLGVLGDQLAAISVKEVLDDDGLWLYNRVAHSGIQASVARVRAALGDEAPEFRAVPDIFMEIGLLTRSGGVAMTPGAVNLQPVDGVSYVPRDFGPTDLSGHNALEEDIAAQVPGPEVFVDDWDDYHRLLGEVHCGTAVLRQAFPEA